MKSVSSSSVFLQAAEHLFCGCYPVVRFAWDWPLGKGGSSKKDRLPHPVRVITGSLGLSVAVLVPCDGRKGRRSRAEGMVLGDSLAHAQPAKDSFPPLRQTVAFVGCLPVAMAQWSTPQTSWAGHCCGLQEQVPQPCKQHRIFCHSASGETPKYSRRAGSLKPLLI